MKNFDHILNWNLLSGSHDFPGPDGGTCINEAAIVAAGFEYKEISSASDCPPCFSRPIAAYAIGLNDRMPDNIRNELLMPFVMRLSGTADTREVEASRVKFIAIAGIQRILSLTCERRLKRPDLAEKCRNVNTLKEADAVADAAADAVADAAADAARKEIYTIACGILNDAIVMGRHTVLDICDVAPRLEKAKAKIAA